MATDMNKMYIPTHDTSKALSPSGIGYEESGFPGERAEAAGGWQRAQRQLPRAEASCLVTGCGSTAALTSWEFIGLCTNVCIIFYIHYRHGSFPQISVLVFILFFNKKERPVLMRTQ